ncbi:hypothetical protein AB0R12_12145, partial [Streptomyces niveus]
MTDTQNTPAHEPGQENSNSISGGASYRVSIAADGKITTSPRLSGIVQSAPLAAERTVSCHHWWLS